MSCAVAVRLKIPDNAAYTALTTLRRLGVDVARIERSEIVRFADDPGAEAAAERVRRDESLYNPNKHSIAIVDGDRPRAGEVWIEQDDGSRTVGWRLYVAPGAPAPRELLEHACERLLCNPAVERAIY